MSEDIPLQREPSYAERLQEEPWRFDFFAVLRRLERSFPERPRIGDVPARRDEYVALGEQAFLDFAASTIAEADRDGQGRLRLFVKFLGLLGPQGPLPLATTEESYHWTLARDDAFPRFLDIFNHRFLQLFYRAWADSRPVAQHDRPDLDRFAAYIGSMIGVGSKPYLKRDSVPDVLEVTATTEDGVAMAIEHRTLPVGGVQFHPESLMSLGGEVGLRIVENAFRLGA